MLAIRSRPRRELAPLLLIVLILLAQFYVRIHHPLIQPAFVDEDHHIGRGEIVYSFDRNPVSFSHGKLLFYYWLGLFHIGGDSALVTGRLAVAIFSLISGATVSLLARTLFGPPATIPSLIFYVLAPWTVFFERMALADPFAGGLAALAVWQTVRMVRTPTRRQGAVAGALLSLTVFAKLTTTCLVGLPVVAVLLMDGSRPANLSRQAWIDWGRALWQRYRRALIAALSVLAAAWGVYLVGMLIYRLSGKTPMLFTSDLIDGDPGPANLWDNLRYVFDGSRYLLSLPMVLLLAVLLVFLLRQHPMPSLFTLAWLLAIWTPIIMLGNPSKTRYLMAGLPAVAVLFGGGISALAASLSPLDVPLRMPSRQTVQFWTSIPAQALVAGVVLVWAVGFALPFAYTAANDPANVELMERDEYTYISSPYTAWGSREALAFMRTHGERVDGRFPLVNVMEHCGSINLYITHDIDWQCYDARNVPRKQEILSNVGRWDVLLEATQRLPFVYLITDFDKYLPPGYPPDDVPLDWELLYTYTRPRGGWTVALWRVSAHLPLDDDSAHNHNPN